MKVIVFGGTGYFGRRLVKKLVENDHEVTVASRGKRSIPCAESVQHLKIDRFELPDKIPGHYDCAIDQIGFDSLAMKALDHSLSADHLVFTSSLSVYDFAKNVVEGDFDPHTHEYQEVNFKEVDYQTGKRQAECYLAQHSKRPFALMRLPFVLGPDDTSGRIAWHFEKLQTNQSIYIPDNESESSFISSQDAANALFFLAEKQLTGAYNVKEHTWSIKTLIETFAKSFDQGPNFAELTEDNHSPFGLDQDLSCDDTKIREAGFQCKTELTRILAEFAKQYQNQAHQEEA